MKVVIFETDQDNELCFAVHLAPTLPFPDKRKWREPVELLAVCAASFKESGWSWICLNSDAKEIIGAEMMDNGCLPLKWYWCQIIEYDESEVTLDKPKEEVE